jgi:integrase
MFRPKLTVRVATTAEVRFKAVGKGFEVKCAGVSLRIYHQTVRGNDLYTLSYYEGRKRIRRNYANVEDAKKEARQVAIAQASGHRKALSLTDIDRDIYVRSVENLAPTGISLDTATAEFARAWTKLEGKASVGEAADYFASMFDNKPEPKAVTLVVEELLADKAQDRRSHEYLRDLRLRLTRFATAFPVDMHTVTSKQINDWLRKLDVTPRTRNNFLRLIRTLFGYAQGKNYVPKFRPHAAAELKPVEVESGDIEIFRPDEIRAMLDGITQRDAKLYLVLGGFCGLRTAEIKRLDWEHIDLDRGYVVVGKKLAKTGQRRIIPIAANLRQWLAPYALEAQYTGKVIKLARPEKTASELAKDMGKDEEGRVISVKWKHNALRHSFISYRIAQIQNLGQVALEAGNSPAVIQSNYLELVTPSEAAEWFAIAPKQADNVIPILDRAMA